MNREETIKVLSILKVAYPNFYKGLSKEEASAVISLWQMQFAKMPGDVVCIAVNKLIATNKFPPAIAEVKAKLKDMYSEAVVGLMSFDTDDKDMESLKRIARYCRSIETEPPLSSLVVDSNRRIESKHETHDKQSGDMPLLQA